MAAVLNHPCRSIAVAAYLQYSVECFLAMVGTTNSRRKKEQGTMRFGLFGSAQAKRGGPDVDSGAGFREFVERNVEAEALGYVSTFLVEHHFTCLLYTSPSPRDRQKSRMPSSA